MNKRIDYYFSLISPWTYLGSRRLEQMAARHGAAIHPMPVDFGRIFPATGGLPLVKRAPERQKYRMMELIRWRDFLGVKLNLEPKFFPAAERHAALATVATRQSHGDVAALRLAHTVLRAVWAEDENIADSAALERLIERADLDGAALMKAAQSPDVAAAYDADIEVALRRGVFGAPTYIHRDELFWGQDRLDFLDRALGR